MQGFHKGHFNIFDSICFELIVILSWIIFMEQEQECMHLEDEETTIILKMLMTA